MMCAMQWAAFLTCSLCAAGTAAHARASELSVKTLAETKISELPRGELYWRVDTVKSVAQARVLAGRWSLIAEHDGKVWVFTLGPQGGAYMGATKVAEVGPIDRVAAKDYLLRVNQASGAPGSTTSVHSHPGSEALVVLAGEQTVRTPQGTTRIEAGHQYVAHGPDAAMQVSSSGKSDLEAFVLFLVDATKPFSSPATLP